MNLLVSEILGKVSKLKTKKEKVAWLKQHDSDGLRMVIKSSFDPELNWLLPEGDVPFTPNDQPDGAGDGQMRLSSQVRMLHNFVKLNRDDIDMEPVFGNPSINRTKREMMFIQLLEGLHEDEAKVVILAKDKALHRTYKGVNAGTVTTAYGWSDSFEPK